MNSALTENVVAIESGELRSRLSIAFAIHGDEMDDVARARMEEALSQGSAVPMAVAAMDALASCSEKIGPILRARLVETADLIARYDFFGRGADAATIAQSERLKFGGE